MGNCFAETNAVAPGQIGTGMASSRRTINKNKLNQSMSISVQDMMGIKKSDSIDNFYDIDKVIGRGSFGEVVKA